MSDGKDIMVSLQAPDMIAPGRKKLPQPVIDRPTPHRERHAFSIELYTAYDVGLSKNVFIDSPTPPVLIPSSSIKTDTGTTVDSLQSHL